MAETVVSCGIRLVSTLAGRYVDGSRLARLASDVGLVSLGLVLQRRAFSEMSSSVS
jgi:hypothetical protein